MSLRDWLAGAATLATSATVGGESGRSVATVATVATGSGPTSGPSVATVATVASPANDPAPVATPEQAKELRELVGIVAADWRADERAEAMAAALADPADALTCFRAIVVERRLIVNTGQEQVADGMRSCVECANLSPGGRCLAAWRGELPGYARGYSPAFIDRPQRCAGYPPGPDDPDRRTGRERWPFLLNVAEGSR